MNSLISCASFVGISYEIQFGVRFRSGVILNSAFGVFESAIGGLASLSSPDSQADSMRNQEKLRKVASGFLRNPRGTSAGGFLGRQCEIFAFFSALEIHSWSRVRSAGAGREI